MKNVILKFLFFFNRKSPLLQDKELDDLEKSNKRTGFLERGCLILKEEASELDDQLNSALLRTLELESQNTKLKKIFLEVSEPYQEELQALRDTLVEAKKDRAFHEEQLENSEYLKKHYVWEKEQMEEELLTYQIDMGKNIQTIQELEDAYDSVLYQLQKCESENTIDRLNTLLLEAESFKVELLDKAEEEATRIVKACEQEASFLLENIEKDSELLEIDSSLVQVKKELSHSYEKLEYYYSYLARS